MWPACPSSLLFDVLGSHLVAEEARCAIGREHRVLQGYVVRVGRVRLGDAVAIAMGLVGLGFWSRPAVVVTWCALWLGVVIARVATLQRLPRFVPERAGVVLPNIDRSRVEASVTPLGAVWLTMPAGVCAIIAPAAAMNADGVPVFAVTSAVVLIGFTWAVVSHQLAATRVALRLCCMSRGRWIEGTITGVGGRFERQIAWRTWSTIRHGTATVRTIHGANVEVATQSIATSSCGTREEVRADLEVTTADGRAFEVRGDANFDWASDRESFDGGDPVRRREGAEAYTLMLFPVVLHERERIRVADRVLVAGVVIERGQLRAAHGETCTILATRLGDPRTSLRRAVLLRSLAVASSVACLGATVGVVIVG